MNCFSIPLAAAFFLPLFPSPSPKGFSEMCKQWQGLLPFPHWFKLRFIIKLIERNQAGLLYFLSVAAFSSLKPASSVMLSWAFYCVLSLWTSSKVYEEELMDGYEFPLCMLSLWILSFLLAHTQSLLKFLNNFS
jgi:hypothetical protein